MDTPSNMNALLAFHMESGQKIKIFTTQNTFFGIITGLSVSNLVYMDLGYCKVAVNMSHIVALSWD